MSSYKKFVLSENGNTMTETMPSDFSTQNSTMSGFSNNYNAEKVQKLFNEFDKITVDETNLKTQTLVKPNALSINKVGFRTKLYLTSATLCIALLLFMAIYNIFVINGLNLGIQSLQGNVSSNQVTLTEVYDQYQELTSTTNVSEELILAGYTDVSADQIVYMDLSETKEVTELTYNSTWFDDVCNFISGIFN